MVGETGAYVGLGSNLHAPARQVAAALHRLAAWPGVTGLCSSRLYRTPPWGVSDQPNFINAVARLHYQGTARQLLSSLLRIEGEAGRIRGGRRWGPRVLDLDLLLFGSEQIDLPGLAVPHPRLAERAFVLLPLHELAPELRLPDGRRLADLVAAIDSGGMAAIGS